MPPSEEQPKPRTVTRIKPDPLGILPGDTITLNVVPHRHLPAGTYECRVLALVTEGPRHETYRIEYMDAGIRKRLDITLYNSRDLFLGQDRCPTAYRHTPNLEARLELSIQLIQRRQR